MRPLQSLLSLSLAKNHGRHPNDTADWTMLPQDLLEKILARLDLADHIRFGSVCSWWRSVAAVENPPINKSFGLVPSADPDRLTRRLLSSILPSWAEAMFIGSFEGWLVVLVDGREMFLLNAGSGERIPLPPPPPDSMPSVYKAVLSSTPSAGSCTVALRQNYKMLWFCKLGDESFTKFYPPQDKKEVDVRFISDLVFYKEQLYAVHGSVEVKVFDSGLNSAPTTLALPTSSMFYYICHLAVSCDKLLALGCGEGNWRSPIKPDKEFELDPAGSRWVGVGSLGDNMLLSTYCISQSFSATEHLRANHVYYDDSEWYDDDDYDYDPRNKHPSGDPTLVFFNLFHPQGFKQIS